MLDKLLKWWLYWKIIIITTFQTSKAENTIIMAKLDKNMTELKADSKFKRWW